MYKTIAIAAVLVAVALTGIFSSTPMAAYADEEAKFKEKATASGDADAFNCGSLNFHSNLNVNTCISEQGEKGG